MTKKLKFVANLYTGNSISDADKEKYQNKLIPYISSKDIDVTTSVVNYDNGMSTNYCDKFKIAKKDSSLLCIEGGSAGRKICYLSRKVSFVNKLCCFEPKFVNGRYLFYSLQSHSFLSSFYENLSGMIGGVSISILSNIKIPVIESSKQIVISNYLDKKVSAIDDFIKKEEKAISELKEYRQSIITKIVLNGLNNKNFKETNIKWMPSIPKHWSFTKVGANCYLKGRIGWQGLTTDEYKDTGPYLITGTDFNNGKINWNTCVHITERRYNEASHIRVKIGDVLITKDGTVGKVAIIDNLPDKTSLNSGVMLMRNINNKYLNKYLYYVLLSNVFWDWFYRDKKENSTIIHLYQEQFEKFSFPIPPKDEQQQIVDYLDKKCDVIDSLIKLKEQKIEKLKEYKKSLIYECVTGRREITCQMN